MQNIIIQKIKNERARDYFKTSLHKEEVEVMILADEVGADLCVIDDLIARKYAKYLKLKVTGTIGVLIKEYEYIDNVSICMDELRNKGIYIDDKLYLRVKKICSE